LGGGGQGKRFKKVQAKDNGRLLPTKTILGESCMQKGFVGRERSIRGAIGRKELMTRDF
jgi:hypothetical protein